MKIINKLIKITPPNYLFFFILLSAVFYFLLPSLNTIPFKYRVIGIPLILLGAFLNIWADKIFKKIDTTVKPLKEPSSFSEEGPFEFTRHPMYLGSISILLGISLGLGNTLSFINPFLMFIILNYIFIPYEENSLEKKFKEEYLKYKEKVGRWV